MDVEESEKEVRIVRLLVQIIVKCHCVFIEISCFGVRRHEKGKKIKFYKKITGGR